MFNPIGFINLAFDSITAKTMGSDTCVCGCLNEVGGGSGSGSACNCLCATETGGGSGGMAQSITNSTEKTGVPISIHH